MGGHRRALGAVAVGALLTLAGTAGVGVPAWAAVQDDDLHVDASIDDRDVGTVTADDPVVLDWQEPALVAIRVHNEGPDPVTVSRVRLEARVLGLAFFAYSTDVDLELAPGAEDERVYSLDMQDLYGQATGKLPGRVVLLDGRTEVAALDVPVQVQAPLRSVYGTFGLAVGAVTVVLLWGALWSLARGRLHDNRWRRAVAFMVPGVGLGFTLTFTVSALGLFLPSAPVWVTLVLVCGAVGFVVGYLTPTPEPGDVDQPDDADDADDADAADATGDSPDDAGVARVGGRPGQEGPGGTLDDDALLGAPWTEPAGTAREHPGPDAGEVAGGDEGWRDGPRLR